MRDENLTALSRRNFLQSGAVATAVSLATATPALSAPGEGNANAPKLIPSRELGKTGVKVSMLNQGTWKSPDSLQRLLRMGYAGGIRYIDTAHSYGSEPGVAQFFESQPGLRKEYFLVTKDGARSPKDLIKSLDGRLEALKTDYVDLFFLHALGGKNNIDLPKSKEFKEVCETIRKSGKAKFVGFSTHDPYKVELLNSAAEGGFVDAIMVAYTPTFNKQYDGMNRALDACHKKGIGLISMKQLAGTDDERVKKEVTQRLPHLVEMGLTPYQVLLHSIWTDERFSSCCVSMRNTDTLRENIQAVRNFQPLKSADMLLLRDALLAARPSFCANCDGSCSRAAGTDAQLGELARLLTYHDHFGFRGEARKQYAELPEDARNWAGADLAAAREACHNNLDFAAMLPRIEKDLA